MSSLASIVREGKDYLTKIFEPQSNMIFIQNTQESSISLKALGELLKSEEFKFWFKMGLSTAGMMLSFYSIYKLLKINDISSTSKKNAKLQGEKLLKKLGIDICQTLNDYELFLAANIIDCQNLQTEWGDIGGLQPVIDELTTSVLAPISDNADKIQTDLYKPPKGLLIYGPPGCGKTMIVRALAKHANARFLNLQTSSIMDMYVGESEKHIEAIFTLAHKIQPVIIFIDEIDGLLSARTNSLNQETFLSIKTLFMSLWDGILTEESSKILVIGASNRPNSIDKAILRRLQIQIEIKLPDYEQRSEIYRVILKNESLDYSINEITYDNLAKLSDGFASSSIKDVCRDAVTTAIFNFKNSNKKNGDRFLLKDSDLYSSVEKHRSRFENMKHY